MASPLDRPADAFPTPQLTDAITHRGQRKQGKCDEHTGSGKAPHSVASLAATSWRVGWEGIYGMEGGRALRSLLGSEWKANVCQQALVPAVLAGQPTNCNLLVRLAVHKYTAQTRSRSREEVLTMWGYAATTAAGRRYRQRSSDTSPPTQQRLPCCQSGLPLPSYDACTLLFPG